MSDVTPIGPNGPNGPRRAAPTERRMGVAVDVMDRSFFGGVLALVKGKFAPKSEKQKKIDQAMPRIQALLKGRLDEEVLAQFNTFFANHDEALTEKLLDFVHVAEMYEELKPQQMLLAPSTRVLPIIEAAFELYGEDDVQTFPLLTNTIKEIEYLTTVHNTQHIEGDHRVAPFFSPLTDAPFAIEFVIRDEHVYVSDPKTKESRCFKLGESKGDNHLALALALHQLGTADPVPVSDHPYDLAIAGNLYIVDGKLSYSPTEEMGLYPQDQREARQALASDEGTCQLGGFEVNIKAQRDGDTLVVTYASNGQEHLAHYTFREGESRSALIKRISTDNTLTRDLMVAHSQFLRGQHV